MFCEHCGKKLPDNAKFCVGCGSPVKAVQSSAQQENPAQPEQQGQPEQEPQRQPEPQRQQESEPQRPQAQRQQKLQGQGAQPENSGGKKSKAPIIALSVLLAVLIIAIVAILVIFWAGSRAAEDVAVTDKDRIEKASDQDTPDEGGATEREETQREDLFAAKDTESGGARPTEGPEPEPEKEDPFASTESTEKTTDYDNLFQGGGAGYIFPDSDTRRLTEEEIEAMLAESDDPLWDIRIAINELYARHGRIFTTPEIQAYFESKDWYEGWIDAEYFDVNQNDYLNDVEIYNRDLLSAYRAALQ